MSRRRVIVSVVTKPDIHLAQFLCHGPTYHSLAMWRHPRTAAAGDEGGRPEPHQRTARVCERGKFDMVLQEPSLIDGRVGIGTSVTVEEANGRRTSYEIVGPDEVEPAKRQISVASPVARALLGKRARGRGRAPASARRHRSHGRVGGGGTTRDLTLRMRR